MKLSRGALFIGAILLISIGILMHKDHYLSAGLTLAWIGGAIRN